MSFYYTPSVLFNHNAKLRRFRIIAYDLNHVLKDFHNTVKTACYCLELNITY
jgi:hypothetical protein